MGPRKYELRWVLDYGGKKLRYGSWSSPAASPKELGSMHNRDSLLNARIEAKDCDGNIFTMAECRAPDFLLFQNIAMARLPRGALADRQGATKLPSQLVGMKIITSTECISVLDTGHIQRGPLPKGFENIKFAAFER